MHPLHQKNIIAIIIITKLVAITNNSNGWHHDHSQREPSWCDCPVLTMRLDYARAQVGSSQVPLPFAAAN